MRSIWLLAGAVALAATAPAAAGGPKGGHGGGGHGGLVGGGHAAKADRGGGGGPKRSHGGGGPKMAHGGGGKPAKMDRGGGKVRVGSVEHDGGKAHGPKQARRMAQRGPERVKLHGGKSEHRQAVQFARDDRRPDRIRNQEGNRFVQVDRRDGYVGRYAERDGYRASYDGCPPGLAAKNNGCLPPGQAKKLIGHSLPAAYAGSFLPPLYRSWYPDNDDYFYRTGDDWVYRVDRHDGLIDGYMPLFDYADYEPDYYSVGERYPVDYVSFYNVPTQYQRYYQDQDDWMYRYGDGAIYRVDRSSGLVDSIVQLLAGDLAIGQQLPAGYDVYNVPYAYRDEYYDTPQHSYRYNDGYIYQVDPKTQLIQAVIQALV